MIFILAYLIMFFDHGVRFFSPSVYALPMVQAVGSISWALFAWGVARGYRCTNDVQSYSMRILLVAVASQIPYIFLFGVHPNPVFALWLGLACVYMSDRYGEMWGLPWLLLAVLSGSHFIMTLAVWWSWRFGRDLLAWVVFWSFWAILSSSFQFVGITFLGLVVCLNENKFYFPKKIKYSIYPLHFLIILAIQKIIQLG